MRGRLIFVLQYGTNDEGGEKKERMVHALLNIPYTCMHTRKCASYFFFLRSHKNELLLCHPHTTFLLTIDCTARLTMYDPGEERVDLQACLFPQGRARVATCAQAQDQPARNAGPNRPGVDRGRRSRRGGRHDGWQISGGRQKVRGFPSVRRSTFLLREPTESSSRQKKETGWKCHLSVEGFFLYQDIKDWNLSHVRDRTQLGFRAVFPTQSYT